MFIHRHIVKIQIYFSIASVHYFALKVAEHTFKIQDLENLGLDKNILSYPRLFI